METATTRLANLRGGVNDELTHYRQHTGPPSELRLDPAFDSVGFNDCVDDLSRAVRLRDESVPGLILATQRGIILAGIANWWLAVCDGRTQISWIEFPIAEEDALQFIINHYQANPGLNDFACIRLALTKEPYFEQKARENMCVGGKYKGSTNLSRADHVEVRRRVADLAHTGVGNVAKVKAILQSCHPAIVAALEHGVLSIHRAWLWCKLPKSQQKEEFARWEEKRTERIISRELRLGASNPSLRVGDGSTLSRSAEASHPSSVGSRISSGGRTHCQPWQIPLRP